MVLVGGGYAKHETGCRKNSVVGAQHCGSQPPNTLCAVPFLVRSRHNGYPPSLQAYVATLKIRTIRASRFSNRQESLKTFSRAASYTQAYHFRWMRPRA